MEWIKTSDRLPEVGQRVLVSDGENIGWCRLNAPKTAWIVNASNDYSPFNSVKWWSEVSPPEEDK